jgi:Mn-dependent DtxR family transcriptional regulator
MSMEIGDWEKLSTVKAAGAKVSTTDLFAKMEGKALTTKKIAEILGVTTSAAYSRMTRLKSHEYVEVRYQGKTGFWKVTEKGFAAIEAGEPAE